jgi:RNA polymerase sigma-70 factor (ECF subfamily)
MALKLLVGSKPEAVDDDELLRRVRLADERAIALLYDRYAAFVAGIALRLLGSEDEVDDVVQHVFLTTVERAGHVYDGQLRSWLFRLASRQALRLMRRRWSRERMRRAVSLVVPQQGDPRLSRSLDELYSALSELSPEIRVPWMLHHIEGQSLPETASICGVSLATIKRRIARAEELIRRRLPDELP